MKISILGAGSFGTAMACHLSNLGNEVLIWTTNETQALAISDTGHNPFRFQNIHLRKTVTASTSMDEALRFSDRVIVAVPTQAVREVLGKVAALEKGEGHFLNLAKGIEVSSGNLLHGIYEEACPGYTYSALSGPSHAEEVIAGLPTLTVLASRAGGEAERWQEIVSGNNFRIYTSEDIIGLEVGGAAKNIYAVAAGIAYAMNLGDNARAALVCRSLAEIMRLGLKMGASPLTLSGLAGAGDLMVTCYSMHSRNFRLGIEIGHGKTLTEAASLLGQVAEGAYTVRAIVENGKKFDVELPLAESVYRVLYKRESPKAILKELMARPLKAEMRFNG